jgi:hypothetical protein
MDQPDKTPEALYQEKGAAAEREWHREQAKNERLEVEESKRLFEVTEAYYAKKFAADKKKGGATALFAQAAEFARDQIKSDGLQGEVRPHSEIRYTVAQGLKAAIHGREDGIATLILQRDILREFDFLRNLLFIVIALLAFIAYKVA